MRSYSVVALVLTIKPRQTYTQCYLVIQLRSVSIQQEGLKERSLLDRNYIRHRRGKQKYRITKVGVKSKIVTQNERIST